MRVDGADVAGGAVARGLQDVQRIVEGRPGAVDEASEPQEARGVGEATTDSVVYASVTILILDYFLTMILW